MYLSVTFDSLWYKNLSKVLEISIEGIKLLGSYVQQEVHSESLRVEHSIVSVSMIEVFVSSMCYVLLRVTSLSQRKD